MGIFGNNKSLHTTPIPQGTPRDQAIAMLHNHTFFISCDPHMISYLNHTTTPPTVTTAADPTAPSSTVPSTSAAAAPVASDLPEEIKPTILPGEAGKTKVFTVTDRVHALPAGIWDSDVVSTYEFTNLTTGVFVRVKSPLAIVMDTLWMIKDAEGEGSAGMVLSEDVTINCTAILLPVVKGQVEGGWKGIHEKMVGKLVEGVN